MGAPLWGASPEILVRHRGSEILSYALAGTAPKDGPNAWTKEQLLTNKKNLVEHNNRSRSHREYDETNYSTCYGGGNRHYGVISPLSFAYHNYCKG